jgi:hypothetical protein
MLDEAFKQKAEKLLHLAESEQSGRLGHLSDEQQAKLVDFRRMVHDKVCARARTIRWRRSHVIRFIFIFFWHMPSWKHSK